MRIERSDWDGADPVGLARRLRARAPGLAEVREAVAGIVARVRDGGDAAVRELAGEVGDAAPESLRVDPERIAIAPALVEPDVREALRVAAANIGAVAGDLAQREIGSRSVELPAGHTVELHTAPVQAAGIYVPGGRAAYPSSVLMGAIPARACGVARVAVVSPPSAGETPADQVLAACAIAGVDEVYSVGGAQAIAALAYGTESIPAVDVIAGPGNRYVTEAKRLVAGEVAIDGLAGPSELAIVADGGADPEWLATDLCAQAEHGDDSSLFLITTDPALAERVGELVAELADARATVADAPLSVIVAPGLEVALVLADALAPEHLQLDFAGVDPAAAHARVAGCVFVGSRAATAFGDYAAGSNHVLPTGGAARFGSPLGPGAFARRTSVVSMPAEAAQALAPHVAAIARAEGLPVHGESAEVRTR